MAKGVAVAEKADEGLAAAVTSPDRPYVHVGLYGEPHSGKSYMVGSFPTPCWVGMFDRRGKELSYVKAWTKRFGALTTKTGQDSLGTSWVEYRAGSKLVGRIAYYLTNKIDETDGVGRLIEYWPSLVELVETKRKFATVALDSVSFMALDARKEAQYVTNSKAKHPMQWYGAAVDQVEEVLCSLLPSLDCNTVAIMHESKVTVEAEGTMVRSPSVPGKRLASTNMVAATFPELYRLYVSRSEDGKKIRQLQTDSDEFFQAGSVIGAPDGCPPKYDGLWTNWR